MLFGCKLLLGYFISCIRYCVVSMVSEEYSPWDGAYGPKISWLSLQTTGTFIVETYQLTWILVRHMKECKQRLDLVKVLELEGQGDVR